MGRIEAYASRGIFYRFLERKRRKKPLNPHPMPTKPVNPLFNFEAEKQDLIWRAFGVNYSHELRQLAEARERFLLQLKSNLMTDDVKDLIEDIVRDEVRRVLRKK
jgi:hypothetical protein